MRNTEIWNSATNGVAITSIAAVLNEAPAAAARDDASCEGLLDTTRFLTYCITAYGMTPVVAVQGTSHRDAVKVDAKSGRHLVAAVNDRGLGLSLLNSHYKDRRAHIGLCLVQSGSDDMLIIDSAPVQRWRNFEPVVDSFANRMPEALAVSGILSEWLPSAATMQLMASSMTTDGYLSNATLHPTAESLYDNYDGNGLGFAFHMVRKMKNGRLPSRTPGSRRVRAIRRPDTLFHAGMMAFDIVKEHARGMGQVDARCSFVLSDKRLIRP